MNFRSLALLSLSLMQLVGCMSWQDQSDLVNHNAPGIIISPSAPSKGTYVGYLLSPDKEFKYPLTLELLEYRVKNKKSLQFKLISQIALGWNSPVYETVVSENVKFSPRKRKFRATKKSEKSLTFISATFSKNNHLKGKYIDKRNGKIYFFRAAWLSHSRHASSIEDLVNGFYPKAIASNISNSLVPQECEIKQPIAKFSFIPTFSKENVQPLSNYIASAALNQNNYSSETNAPASRLTAKINFAEHQLDFIGGESAGVCKFSKNGVNCGKCNFASLNAELATHFAGSSDRLPLATEEANLNSSATKGSYYGYAHIEGIDTYQPLRLKIDPANNKVVITKFFGNPDDSEYIIHKLTSADSRFSRSSLVDGDADNFAQLSWATKNLVTGIIYSKSSGRIGRFAAHKKGLTLDPSAKKIGKISGYFVSDNKHLEIMVTPGVSVSSDSKSPLGIRAILKSSNSTQPTMMEGGVLDLGHQLLYLDHATEGPLTLSIAGRDMKIADAKLRRQNERSRTAKTKPKKNSTIH